MERRLQVDYGRTYMYILFWLFLIQLSRCAFSDLAHFPRTRNARSHRSLKEGSDRCEDIPAIHRHIREWFNKLLFLPGMFVTLHLLRRSFSVETIDFSPGHLWVIS